MDNLGKKTATGFLYKFMERAGAQGINFIVSLILARLLMPEQYGIIALVSVFIILCDVFVTYGFGNSLVVYKDTDSVDFSTCFYFGLMLSTVIYIGVFFFAPVLADYYGYEILTPVVRVMALRIPLSAVNSVQHAYVSKHMMFRKFFYATLIGTIISGVIAVIMAYAGFGIWALVEQYIVNILIDTLCLFLIVRWRPTLEFSFRRLKRIYHYGWKILAVGLLDTGYAQLRNLVIAKKYSASDLAYYNKGDSFPGLFMNLIEPTVSGVMFPALSSCNDDLARMRQLTRVTIRLSTYITFPIMIGLIVVARPLIITLLTEKWATTVTFMQISCLGVLFRPVQFINSSVIRASGRSGLLLKLDIIKKVVGIGLLFGAVPFGVIWVAWSLVATNLFATILNIGPNKKILNYGYTDQLKDVCENLLIAAVMGAAAWCVTLLPLSSFVCLLIQVPLGVAVYVAASAITKNESFTFCIDWLKKLKEKRLNKETASSAEAGEGKETTE